ncbi:MAG: hypothetical protein EOP85_04140 [Verrucomicrobiaceae bacterium]|nr:MAG: hypothetical protein EOP85_04140 [Verrucomicrobiaceae bacterium]
MPLRPESIEKRAVKAGVKASKKRHHLVTKEELLALKIQVMPALPRIILVTSGALLITFCCLSWPSADIFIRSLEGLSGAILLLIGAFGIRRTLESTLDSHDAVNLVGSILETVADAVSNIDL